MQAVVDIIRGCVAKLLLWPLDVVDFLHRDMLQVPRTANEARFIGAFMAFWYVFFIYSLCSLYECLI